MMVDLSVISVAVTEAQAVLDLAAHKLDTDKTIDPDEAFGLHVALHVALKKLDEVHDALTVPTSNIAPTGVMQ